MPCKSVQSCWNCVFSPESPDMSWVWIPLPTFFAALPIPLWLLLIVVAKLPTTESIQSPSESTGVVRLSLMEPASPLTALTTLPTFFLMPVANSFMKSGIYSSASDRGPSSGTEKCSRLLTLAATDSAAAITEPAAARTPAAIWEQISAPQRYAEEAIELKELKLLLMFATPEDTVLRRFDIAEDTVDFTLLKVELVEDCTPLHPPVTVVRTADTEEVVRLLMLFHAVVMTVLMPFQLVFVSVFTAFHALVMEERTAEVAEVVRVLIPFHAARMTLLMPFQLEVVSDFTAFHALVMEDFTAAVAEVTLDFTAEKLF